MEPVTKNTGNQEDRENFIDDALSHGLLLHESGEGVVAIAHKSRGEWNEKVFRVKDLPTVLPDYAGKRDVYISQNRFFNWRGVARLAELSAMYADIDYYNHPDLAEMPVQGVFTVATEALASARLPQPSLAVATGRGLALVWRHAPVPQAKFNEWTLCQSHIWRTLRKVGADRVATDAARVLRLVGTINSRSGTVVEPIWQDTGHIWEFDDLAKEILPDELEGSAKARNRQSSQRSTKQIDEENSNNDKAAQHKLTITSLNQARLEDLHKLMDLRGWEKLPPGKRDSWMLIAATCLSRLVRPEFLRREVNRLAKEVAGWSRSETNSRMQQIFVRANAADSGDKVLWEGSWKDPRYEFTNHRIIEMLDITPTEEQQLKTLLSERTRLIRDRERKKESRRGQGVKPRKEYLQEAKNKRRRARRLKDKGYRNSEIAQRIGCSIRHVTRLLS